MPITIRPGLRAIKQISDEKVQVETGKTWMAWMQAIDRWVGDKAELWPIVQYLTAKYALTHLWATTIASYYLIEQMERDVHLS